MPLVMLPRERLALCARGAPAAQTLLDQSAGTYGRQLPQRQSEERAELLGGALRNLLRKEVTAVERLDADVIGPSSPQRKRAAILAIPCVQRSAATPEHEHRAGDPASGVPIQYIMRVVERCCRAVFLADRVNMRAITQRLDIVRPQGRIERLGSRAPTAKRIVDHGIGCSRQQPLGKRRRLRQQRPRPIAGCQPFVGPLPGFGDRNDVENSETLDASRMIERETIRDAAAAICPAIEKRGCPSVSITATISFAIYSPTGDLIGKIHIPETVANLCFGGQQRNRMYICGSTSLYAVYTSVQGAMKP
jgi:hypothetical protein